MDTSRLGDKSRLEFCQSDLSLRFERNEQLLFAVKTNGVQLVAVQASLHTKEHTVMQIFRTLEFPKSHHPQEDLLPQLLNLFAMYVPGGKITHARQVTVCHPPTTRSTFSRR